MQKEWSNNVYQGTRGNPVLKEENGDELSCFPERRSIS